MNETLTRPEVADEVVDRAEINGSTVLVEYNRTEAAIVELKARYSGVQFDVATTAGDRAARAARLELTRLRTGLDAKRKEFKAPALEFGRRIDSEAKRLEGEILALEMPIDAQIKVEEARKAAEKAERERIEAARIARLMAYINEIRASATGHGASSSSVLAIAIAAVTALNVDAIFYEEFAELAAAAKVQTLATLADLHAGAVEREDEAYRLAEERAELARLRAEQLAAARIERERAAAQQAQVAAEQAAERQRLADDMAEQRRQLAEELAAAQRLRAEADRAAAALRAEADRLANEARVEAQRQADAELAAARAESERLEALAEANRAALAEVERKAEQDLQDAHADRRAEQDLHDLHDLHDLQCASTADVAQFLSHAQTYLEPTAGPLQFAGPEPEDECTTLRGQIDVLCALLCDAAAAIEVVVSECADHEASALRDLIGKIDSALAGVRGVPVVVREMTTRPLWVEPQRAKPRVVAKYRNAATGETWTGRGLQPKWLRNALVDGASLAEFTISTVAA